MENIDTDYIDINDLVDLIEAEENTPFIFEGLFTDEEEG